MNSYDELQMHNVVSQSIHLFLRILEVKSENSENWLKMANKCLGFLILSNYDVYTEQKSEFEALIKESLTAGDQELTKLKSLLSFDSSFLSDEEVQSKILDKMVVEQPVEVTEVTENGEDDDEEEMAEEVKEKMAEESTEIKENALIELENTAEVIKSAMKTNNDATVDKINDLKSKIPECDAILQKYQENYTFDLTRLDDNFDHVYQHYMYSTCDKCGNRPNKSDFGVCLLCGVILCMRQCEGSDLPNGNLNTILNSQFLTFLGQPGNLCQHMTQDHAGSSVFLNIMKGTYFLYERRRLYEFEGIYSDDYGMTLKDYKWKNPDLNTIQLNREVMNKLRTLLVDHKITEELVQRSLVENKMFNRMYY